MNKLFITFILILSSCTITQEISKCELMLRGEECLSDHRCCNPPQAYNQTHSHWNWWYWNKPIVNLIFLSFMSNSILVTSGGNGSGSSFASAMSA